MIASLLICASVLRLVIPTSQEGTQQVRDLIEKLRSDRVEEREEAARKLEALDKSAEPELEKAASDKDPEVAGRVRRILKLLRLRRLLTPRLRQAMPWVEDRLAEDDDRAWTDVLLELTKELPPAWKTFVPGENPLRGEDLEILAVPALRGALNDEEKVAVCRSVARWRLASAAPGLVKLLKEKGAPVRYEAASALGSVGSKESIQDLVALLDDKAFPRLAAMRALATLEAACAIPSIADFLGSEEPLDRRNAIQALAKLGGNEALLAISPMLMDPDWSVRLTAVRALGGSGAKTSIPPLCDLLEDRRIRHEVAQALCRLGSRKGVPVILEGQVGTWGSLNRVRQPEASGRLNKTSVSNSCRGTRWQVVEFIAKEADLRLEFELSAVPPEFGAICRLPELSARESGALDRLEWALSGTRCEAIVEADCVRILSRQDALKFWVGWWKAEQEKK